MSKQTFRGIRIVKEWLRIGRWIKQNRPMVDRVDQAGLSHAAGYVARLAKPSSPGGLLLIAPPQGTGVTMMREAYQLFIRLNVNLVPSGRKVKQPYSLIFKLYRIIFARKLTLSPPAAEPEKEQAIRKLFAELNIAPDEDSVADFRGYAGAVRYLRYPISSSVDQATRIIQRLLREVYHVQEADGLSFFFFDLNNLVLHTMSEQDCKRAIAMNPDDMRARESLAYTYLQQKRYAEAEAEYNQVLVAHPNYINARQCLAYVYLQQKRYADAEEEYSQILAAAPDDTSARDNLAYTYIQQQRYARAVKEFKRALDTDPDDLFAHENLAYIYDKQRRFVDAEHAYKSVLVIDPNDKCAQLGLGDAYFGQQRYAEAEQEYNRVLAVDPGNEFARYKLADLAYIDARRKRKQSRNQNMRKPSN